MIRTQSGRISRTQMVQIAAVLVQLPTAITALLGILPVAWAAGVACVCAVVANIATAYLRTQTTEGMAPKAPPDPPALTGGTIGGLILLLICSAAGCGTLELTAKTSHHCALTVGPPGVVACYVDGDLRYRSEGPKLEIKINGR